jgi:hypothetical protein
LSRVSPPQCVSPSRKNRHDVGSPFPVDLTPENWLSNVPYALTDEAAGVEGSAALAGVLEIGVQEDGGEEFDGEAVEHG